MTGCARRKLRKKLRAIVALEEKMAAESLRAGDLNEDQVAKLRRKGELEAQLRELGAGAR